MFFAVFHPAKLKPSFSSVFSGIVISVPATSVMLSIVPVPPFASKVTV